MYTTLFIKSFTKGVGKSTGVLLVFGLTWKLLELTNSNFSKKNKKYLDIEVIHKNTDKNIKDLLDTLAH